MIDPQLNRVDIILYSIRSIRSNNETLDRKRMSRSLGLKLSTFNRYLRDIIFKGHLRSVKNESGRIMSYKLTEAGLNGSEITENVISSIILDPEVSGFLKKVPLDLVLKQLRDTYERIELIDRFFIHGEQNVARILEETKFMRSDSNISYLLREVFSMDGEEELRSLEEILTSSSIYSICQKDGPADDPFSDQDIDHLILKAEVQRRMGSVKEALCIYDGLLRRRKGLESNRWILCFSGIVQCMVYENDFEDTLELLNNTMESTRNPTHKAFLKKVKADIMQDLDSFIEASGLYRSCLGIFQERTYPVIRASVLNNLGVLYFRKGEKNIAMGLWEDALKIVKKIGLKWSIHMTSINLADVYSLQGNTKKALRLLGEARSFLKTAGDLEGISDVDFNMALVQIEKGDEKRAMYYFNRSEDFPLSYRMKVKEKREVFKGRMESKGW